MRKLGWMVALVVVAIACSSAGDMLGEILDSGVPDAGAQSGECCTRMQYVGNTSQAFPGGIGLYKGYAACQADYGAGHRICDLNEIRYTTSLPQLTDGELAWFGVSSCQSWASGSSQLDGSLVNSTGNTIADGVSGDPRCDSEKPFACCGPK